MGGGGANGGDDAGGAENKLAKHLWISRIGT
jgi:hypothetical protein